jgi:hypothetical protein
MSNYVAERFKRFAAAYQGATVHVDAKAIHAQQSASINGTVHPDMYLGPPGLVRTPEAGIIRMVIPTNAENFETVRFMTGSMLQELGLCSLGARCEAVPANGVTLETNGRHSVTVVFDPQQAFGSPSTPQMV